jgi:hypothetical protein
LRLNNNIKLKLPDKYDGTRDVTAIENFFCAVDKLQSIKGWDERKTFLIASTLLSGRAETWVNHLEKLNDGSAPTTWTHLKEFLTSCCIAGITLGITNPYNSYTRLIV